MATNPHAHDDLGDLVIGGASVLCVLRDVGWDHASDTEDVRGPCRFGALNQVNKDQATLTARAYGTTGDGYRTSHLHLTALTVAGVDIRPVNYGISLQGAFDKQALPAIGVLGRAEGVAGKNYNGVLDLQLDDSGIVQDIVVACESRDIADREAVFHFTINGRPFTCPVLLSGNNHTSSQAEYQRVSVNYMSQAPIRPNPFPTLPAALPATPTLLDWALVTPKNNLAFTFTSKLTSGIVRSGFLTWDSFGVTIRDGEVTGYDYGWKTFGDWDTEHTS